MASSTVSGSSGQPGVSEAYPAFSKSSAQRSQLLGRRKRPCTNTTGVRPDAFDSSTCFASSCVIVGSMLIPSSSVDLPIASRTSCLGRSSYDKGAG